MPSHCPHSQCTPTHTHTTNASSLTQKQQLQHALRPTPHHFTQNQSRSLSLPLSFTLARSFTLSLPSGSRETPARRRPLAVGPRTETPSPGPLTNPGHLAPEPRPGRPPPAPGASGVERRASSVERPAGSRERLSLLVAALLAPALSPSRPPLRTQLSPGTLGKAPRPLLSQLGPSSLATDRRQQDQTRKL